jgi:acylphosphatase
MEQLTAEQFKQKFGISLEEYSQANPDLVSPVTNVDYGNEKPNVPSEQKLNRRAMKRKELEAWPTNGDPIREIIRDHFIEKDERSQKFEDNSEQFVKNMASGIGQIPTDVVGMFGMIKAGAPAIVEAYKNNGNSDDPYYKRLMQEFSNNVIPLDQQFELQAHMSDVMLKVQEEHPELTPDQLNDIRDQYMDSDKFQQLIIDKMPKSIQIAMNNGNFMNELFGTGKRIDQQTIQDDIAQIVGQSVVALPTSVVSAPRKVLTKLLGKQVMENIVTRGAMRVGEAITPITVPGTVPNMALNAGVGTGIIELQRYASDMPSFLNQGAFFANQDQYDHFVISEEVNPARDLAEVENELLANTAMTGGLAMTLFGGYRLRQIAKQVAKSADEKLVDSLDVSKGARTIEEQSDALEPTLNEPTIGLVDNTSGPKKIAQANDGEEITPLIEYELSSASATNISENVNKAMNFGDLSEGLRLQTTPKTLLNNIASLDVEEQDILKKAMFGISREQDQAIRLKQLDAEVEQLNAEIAHNRRNQNTAKLNNNIRALQDAAERRQRLIDDDPISRTSFRNLPTDALQAAVRVARNNPKLSKIIDDIGVLSRTLSNHKYRSGMISREQHLKEINDRPIHLPIQQASRAEERNPIKRKALLMKDRLFPAMSEAQGAKLTGKVRNLEEGEVNVEIPIGIDAAIKRMITNTVEDVARNRARVNVLNMLDSLPSASSKALRRVEFSVGGKKVTRMTHDQFYGLQGKSRSNFDIAQDMAKTRNIAMVYEKGQIAVWELADPSVAKALEFAPDAVVPIFNGTRKVWQQATTGLLQPAFSVVSGAFWEPIIAKTTNMKGRSLGIIDTRARSLAQGTMLERPVNAIADQVFDPTAFLTTWAAIPRAMLFRTMRHIAVEIVQSMERTSPIIQEATKQPLFKNALLRGAENAIRYYDSSAFGIQSRELSSSMAHLNDATRIIDDYANAATSHASIKGLQTIFNMYRATVESIQQSTKTAFFSQNYWRLHKEHNGKIPKTELKKLIQETRNLTGDMSRTSANKRVQQAVSVIPYGNAILQGTRHMLAATIPPQAAKAVNAVGGNMITQRSNKFWGQFTTAVMLPKIASLYVMSQWEGAQDWYDNKLTSWERLNGIYFPSADAIKYRWDNGKWPKFNPDHMNKVPLAPEFTMLAGPAEAFMRSMGLFGMERSEFTSLSGDLGEIGEQAAGFATPPLFQMFFAFSGNKFDLHAGLTGKNPIQPLRDPSKGGANADNMTIGSEIAGVIGDVVGAAIGTAGNIAATALNVADIEYRETDDFWSALEQATEVVDYEYKRRLPDIDVPGVFNGRTRSYSFTRQAEYVRNAEKDLEPIFGSGRQLTVERDSEGDLAALEAQGLRVAKKIKDPALRTISMYLWDNMKKKGVYKQANQEYGSLRTALDALEGSRNRMPENEYHAKRNKIVRRQQQLKQVQADELLRLNSVIQDKVGKQFEKKYEVPFTFKNLSDLVRQDTL